jgi:hypothetical protein
MKVAAAIAVARMANHVVWVLVVVSILGSHRRDPGSIPCNVTCCSNLQIVTHV